MNVTRHVLSSAGKDLLGIILYLLATTKSGGSCTITPISINSCENWYYFFIKLSLSRNLENISSKSWQDRIRQALHSHTSFVNECTVKYTKI